MWPVMPVTCGGVRRCIGGVVVFWSAVGLILGALGCGPDSGEGQKPVEVGPKPNTGLREVALSVGDVRFTVEIADTDASRMVGLMHRDSMPWDHGMLFVFEEPKFQRFYMKNTRIPLDIAFIRDNGVIDQVKQMKPYSLEKTISEHQVRYVLEMNQGWFESRGLGPGDRIGLSPLEQS